MTNQALKSGMSREEVSLLPPRVEDYVDRDNPVQSDIQGAIDLTHTTVPDKVQNFIRPEMSMGV